MTPKEKAKELVKKFAIGGWGKENAKTCVDEILNNDGFTRFDDSLTEYWQNVKIEIDAL